MLWQPTRGMLQPNRHWRRGQGAAGGGGAEATAFLARTSGLDATHTNAYIALIDGLVADSIFTKFDVLYIFATQDATTAVLNLASSNFTITVINSPTFTADRGYQAVGGGDCLDSNFNPTTAGSPQFTQNSAHWSLWNNINTTNTSVAMTQTSGDNIYAKYADGNSYFRINDNAESGGYANSDPRGLLTGNRSSSSAIQGYVNASSLGSATSTSKAVFNGNVKILGDASGSADSTHQFAAASIGSSLSSGDVSSFYGRMQTYMTTVGN